jgi:5-methylcytosine-specific restriction endonuclease McrBC regulatory subunit McrC
VRHDVFTPDRAENRLIKTAAAVLAKLTQEHRNGQELKKLMIYLDEVKLSDSCERDFAACVNTRNAKKYTAVLNICRMLLAKKSSGFSGKYASCAIFFPMQELFAAYMAKLAKAECKNTVVKTMAKAGFVCGENRLFPIMPHIAVYEKSGEIRSVTNIKWSHISSVNEINSDDIFRLLAAAEELNCDNAVMLYPSYAHIPDTMLTMNCGKEIALTIKFADFSEGTITGEFSCETSDETDFTEEYTEETDLPDTAEYSEKETAEDEKIPEETAETETAETNPMPEKKRVKILRHKK